MKGILKGPCKHKSIVAKTYKIKNGIERESDWFRPLLEEQENMSIRKSSQSESDEEEDTSSTELLAQLKKSVFCFLFKVQNRFGHDSEQYKKAINAFIKQCDKLSDGNDAMIQNDSEGEEEKRRANTSSELGKIKKKNQTQRKWSKPDW